MKRFAAIIAALALCASSALGQTAFTYTDATTLPVFGKACPETAGPFTRLPASLKGVSRDPVWGLGRNSAGLFVRFTSDAGEFDLKWTTGGVNTLDNMTAIVARGLALYTLDKGEWIWVGTARPNRQDKASSFRITCSKLAGSQHEYMLYLSLYNEVTSLQIGVPEGSTIAASSLNSPRAEKPIIIYGTSIMQGASASHPGMCSSNQLSRRLDRVVINLGFSGNGKLDYEIAELMAAHPDPAVFVMDNIPNCGADLIREKTAGFVKILRDAHPDVPIVFVENPIYPGARFDDAREKEVTSRNEALAEVYAGFKKAGMKKIYYVKGDKMLGADNTGTVEGTHFTDLGFEGYVKLLYPVLKKLYK